ncbi:hypothetical protein BKA67DRAFT_413009 [Truncatella angustata]|uniref:Uncharacterized protein n=1 Tax=Truncatella angustata TaxID=152316 RepID=A0A9P8RII3_9PEZI|nr:uncharacterized protein BKA67DRAFT_413009 [Truncatella angustata]KAH6646673.1 hypothetical protein BKA67DRAFT_413009 [Truncatella angustata]
MGTTTRIYRPPTVEEAPDEIRSRISSWPQGDTSVGNDVTRGTQETAASPISDRLLTLVPANPRKRSSSVVEPVRIPGKRILKRTGSPMTAENIKRVRFGEAPAVDITNGEVMLPGATSGKEYRERKHSAMFLTARRQRIAARLWRRTARCIAEQALLEVDARRRGGRKRVHWRRGLIAFFRKNGLNGNIDTMGRFCKDRHQAQDARAERGQNRRAAASMAAAIKNHTDPK